MTRSTAGLLLLLPLLGACASAGDPDAGPTARPAGPSLVVVVAVDQLRGDLLTRYEDLFQGGIRRLLDQGTSFPRTTFGHAETATGPGHATISTGMHPAGHGIAGNGWSELRDGAWREVYAVEDAEHTLLADPELPGRSPANLRRDGLADWIRAAHPDARVVSVSRKDRAAIPLAGRGPGHVYWLALDQGVEGFTTSTFYRDSLPEWVQSANDGLAPVLWSDTVWTNEAPREARERARPDPFPTEGDGVHTTLPHRAWQEAGLPGREEWGDWLEGTPSTDAAVLHLASRAVRELALGRREAVDYLALGLSSTDGVGHGYGPWSQEQLDNLLRLDRGLGTLMDSLDAAVGPDGWVLALTGDHGVVEMVEWRQAQGLPGHRLTGKERAEINARARTHAGDPDALASALEELEVVADAMTLEELRDGGTPADTFVPLFRRSHVEGRVTGPFPGSGVVVRFREGVYGGSLGTGHGSPYHYDRWVPFLLYGPGVPAAVREEPVGVVDVAPTLARLVGVPTPSDLDGVARAP